MTPLKELQARMSQERDARFKHATEQCPPVSKQLIEHLKLMFTKKRISPTSPSMANELIFQHGIEKIIMYLEARNAEQEARIRKEFSKDNDELSPGLKG